MPGLAVKRQPDAYAELSAANGDTGPSLKVVKQGHKDSPVEAAQRRLQQISFESYQTGTKPERITKILAELRLGTEHENEAIASVARYALQRAESTLRYKAQHQANIAQQQPRL